MLPLASSTLGSCAITDISRVTARARSPVAASCTMSIAHLPPYITDLPEFFAGFRSSAPPRAQPNNNNEGTLGAQEATCYSPLGHLEKPLPSRLMVLCHGFSLIVRITWSGFPGAVPDLR